MHILHLSALPIWPINGKGGMPSLSETLKGHVREGHRATVILPRYAVFGCETREIAPPENVEYDVHITSCRWLPAVHRIRGVFYRLAGKPSLPFAIRWAVGLAVSALLTVSLVKAARQVRRREQHCYDIVYANNEYAVVAGWLLGRLWRIPNVNRLYGTFLADLMEKPLVRLRYPVAAGVFLVPHDLLICTNDGTRGDDVARKLKIDLNKLRFWQNGIDIPETQSRLSREEIQQKAPSNLRADATWVFSCSRLSYWKRIDRMLHALRQCRTDGCECQLLIAGDGPERERLHLLAEKLGVADRTVWFGAITHDAVWDLMNASDVVMLTNDVTNRCNPLYEAISIGKPIVSVYDPSTKDLLEHGVNALLAERDDLEQLGANVKRLCVDTALRVRLVHAQAEKAAIFWRWSERLGVEVKDLERICRKNPA